MSQFLTQGPNFVLEILVISPLKSLRMIICMCSGEQKCQNDPENQMISKLYLENSIFYRYCDYMLLIASAVYVSRYDVVSGTYEIHVARNMNGIVIYLATDMTHALNDIAYTCITTS